MTQKTRSAEENNTSSRFVCNQNSLLMNAIDAGTFETAEKLLSESGKFTKTVVNVPYGRLQVTALQLAAAKCNLGTQLIHLLLLNGAKADVADKLGRTPLHHAAQSGNEETVEALIKAGAQVNSRFQISPFPEQKLDRQLNLDSNYILDVDCKEYASDFKLPIPECWGRTPLHQAVKSGNPTCVSLLLQAGAKVNAQDEKGTTPLLLAGAGMTSDNKNDVNRYEEIVQLLVKAGAYVNIQNQDSGRTALNHAVVLHSMQAIQCLLEAGAKVNKSAEGSTTVLHDAAKSGCVAIIECLLKKGADNLVNAKDKVGCTPLHTAAYVGARDCLAALLRYGGDMAVETNTNVSVMDAVFSHVPRPVHFLTDILNGSIVPNCASVNDRDFKVTLDFSVLCPHGREQQMKIVTALMSGASKFQQMRILQHPLLETFLRFKWHRLRLIFAMLAVVHACFVASLSTYSLLLVYKDNKATSIEVVVSRRVLLVSAWVLFIHSSIQILLLPRHYVLQYETWVNFTCILLSFAIGVAGETGNYSMSFLENGTPTKSTWVLHVMSFAVLLAWIELMLLMGRFPTYGYYALMFYQVLQNVIKVLLTFGGLVMGFALSFCVQFHESLQFRNLWWSVMKTFVMMMGEYEYGELFPEDDKTQLRLKGTSRIIFLAFVVLSSIVLMNLMVGLAVNDIQELQTEGHIQRLLKQAEFLAHCEKLTTHRMLKSAYFPHWLHKMLDGRRSIETTFVIQPSKMPSGYRTLSYTLLEAIVGVAIHNQQKCAEPRTEYSNDDHRNQENSGGDMSAEEISSPTSPHSSIMVLLHQLQQDVAEIHQILLAREDMEMVTTPGMMAGNFDAITSERRLSNQSIKPSRWRRPVTDIQEAQGILRRMRRNNSSHHNVIV